MKCDICQNSVDGKSDLAKHLLSIHRITSEIYTIKHILNNSRPTCPECGDVTKYHSFGFKKYCDKHLSLVEKVEKEPRKKEKIISKEMLEISNDDPFKDDGGKQEIKEFLKSLNIKNILLDSEHGNFYLPDYGLAIDYNQNALHIEEVVGKTYHQDRYEACKRNGIQLYQIFSDEWLFKKEICKSMIKHRLGISKNRYMARNCRVEIIPNKTASEFFNRTHIAGGRHMNTSFGLFFEDKLLACVSVKLPIQKKYGNCLEIYRFSTEYDTHVAGGMSKLMKKVKNWAKEKGYERILSYAEQRFGHGDVYPKAGFEDITPKKPNIMYWYVGYYENTNFQKRFFRFKFRASKIPKKTEKEVAEEAKVWKLYGSGNSIFKMEL